MCASFFWLNVSTRLSSSTLAWTHGQEVAALQRETTVSNLPGPAPRSFSPVPRPTAGEGLNAFVDKFCTSREQVRDAGRPAAQTTSFAQNLGIMQQILEGRYSDCSYGGLAVTGYCSDGKPGSSFLLAHLFCTYSRVALSVHEPRIHGTAYIFKREDPVSASL